MTKEDKILDVLKVISSRLQELEKSQRDLMGIVTEMGTDLTDIRAHQLDDANRTGGQVHRHENQIIEINARLAKLDGQAPKARTGNGSTRR